jgi:hypothetical protein
MASDYAHGYDHRRLCEQSLAEGVSVAASDAAAMSCFAPSFSAIREWHMSEHAAASAVPATEFVPTD